MKLEQSVEIPAPVEEVWAFLMDVPAVATCVPGVETLEQRGDDLYGGVLRVAIGPIVVHLEGQLEVTERDAIQRRAQMRADATDHRVRGGVTATMSMTLTPTDGGATAMGVETDAVVLGRLGEFGQPIIRRKADQIMAEFARRLTDRMAAADPTLIREE